MIKFKIPKRIGKFKTPRRNRIRKRSGSEIVVFAIAFVILFSVGFSYIFSFFWGALSGLKTHDEIIMTPWEWPAALHFENYADVFRLFEVNKTGMFGMIFNSLWLVVGGSFCSVFAATMMAYAVTKYEFPGRHFLVTMNIIMMTLPIIGSFPARYRLFSALGFINSPKILLSYLGGFGSYNLFMCAFFRGISPTYSEAAMIDGANDYDVLFKIILPLSKGMLSALLIMQAVAVWNDYDTALVYMPKLPTLATGVYIFETEMTFRARKDILMAATIISAIPPLLLYLVGHQAILENVSIGGIKG